MRLLFFLACLVLFASPPHAAPRVASLNLCADRLLLAMAEPEQIAGLTYLADDPLLAGSASARYPKTHASAEELAALAPDLAVGAEGWSGRDEALLARVGVPVRQFDAPRRLSEVPRLFEAFGAAIGQAERGKRLAEDFDWNVADLEREEHGPMPRVLILYPGGYAEPPGTLLDDMLGRLGARNYLASRTFRGVESLLLDPPDLLVAVSDEQAAPTLGAHPAFHPAVEKLMRDRTVRLPVGQTICATPQLLKAMRRIRRALS